MNKNFFASSIIITLLSTPLAYSIEKKPLSFAENFFIGAAAGCGTTVALEPIIYVKNTWQQNKSIILKPRVMYRGLFVSAAGFIPSMAIQTGVYSTTEKYLNQTNLEPSHKKILSAIAAGTASAIASCPRDLLVIQQQNNGGSLYSVCKNIFANHGSIKLFRGFIPVALGNSSFAGFFFIATPTISQEVKKHTDNPIVQTLAPSIISGTLSAALTHPLNTLKTCMQAELTNKNSIQTIRTLYYDAKKTSPRKGLSAFYRGLTPRIVGVAATMTLEYNLRAYFSQLYALRKAKNNS